MIHSFIQVLEKNFDVLDVFVFVLYMLMRVCILKKEWFFFWSKKRNGSKKKKGKRMKKKNMRKRKIQNNSNKKHERERDTRNKEEKKMKTHTHTHTHEKKTKHSKTLDPIQNAFPKIFFSICNIFLLLLLFFLPETIDLLVKTYSHLYHIRTVSNTCLRQVYMCVCVFLNLSLDSSRKYFFIFFLIYIYIYRLLFMMMINSFYIINDDRDFLSF